MSEQEINLNQNNIESQDTKQRKLQALQKLSADFSQKESKIAEFYKTLQQNEQKQVSMLEIKKIAHFTSDLLNYSSPFSQKIFFEESYPYFKALGQKEYDYDQFLNSFKEFVKLDIYGEIKEPSNVESQEQNNLLKLQQNVHSNRRRLDKFFANYQPNVLAILNDFSQIHQDSENSKISVHSNDIPLVFRLCFQNNGEYFLYERNEDTEEFFNKPQAFGKFLETIQAFFADEKAEKAVLSEIFFGFELFQEFVYYFFKKNSSFSILKLGEQVAESKTQFQQESNLEKDLRSQLEKYKRMLLETQNPVEQNTLKKMISVLEENLKTIQQSNKPQLNTSTFSIKKKKTLKEIRETNIRQIYLFYCKQQFIQGPQYSFERILHESSTLNLAMFMMFCKQFNITNKNKHFLKGVLPSLFRKNCVKIREMDYEEFKLLFEHMGILMYEDQHEQYPSEQEKVEQFYQFLEVDSERQFRIKMKLLNPAFNIQVKEGFRLLPQDAERELKATTVDPRRKEEFLNYKDMKKSELEQSIQQAKKLELINNDEQKQKSKQNFKPMAHYVFDNYKERLAKNDILQTNLVANHVNLSQLQEISPFRNIKFKPTDLIDNYEPDDEVYLKEFGQFSAKTANQRQSQPILQSKEGKLVDQITYGMVGSNLAQPAQIQQLPLRQKNYSNHQKSTNNGSSMGVRRSGGGYSLEHKASQIGRNYSQRAQQIERQQNIKHIDQLQRISSIIDSKSQLQKIVKI